jgi:hypothetical protein
MSSFTKSITIPETQRLLIIVSKKYKLFGIRKVTIPFHLEGKRGLYKMVKMDVCTHKN